MPSSRDTALTIAADKGHFKFVELLLHQGSHVDVKNKKGNSPLWLAANGMCTEIEQVASKYSYLKIRHFIGHYSPVCSYKKLYTV